MNNYFNMLKVGMLCFCLLGLNTLVACQEKKAATEQPQSQATPDNALLKQLSGKIVFDSDRDGNWEIYAMNADGSDLVRLTNNPAADEYPVWSPDGKQIAFQSERDGNSEIYVMDADGSNQRRITNHPAHDRSPEWSPDGKRIAFDSERDNDLEVYIMNADGSDVTMATDAIGKDILPAWSPDGKWLTYTGNRYLGWNIYVVNLETKEDKRLTDNDACRPDWSPDGKKIAYVSSIADGKGDIWLMNADGSDQQRLTPDDHNYDYYPAWSRDGKFIAYAKAPDKQSKDKGSWQIWAMSADGKQHVQITHDASHNKFPDWK